MSRDVIATRLSDIAVRPRQFHTHIQRLAPHVTIRGLRWDAF